MVFETVQRAVDSSQPTVDDSVPPQRLGFVIMVDEDSLHAQVGRQLRHQILGHAVTHDQT